jgi:hypothetical protein
MNYPVEDFLGEHMERAAELMVQHGLEPGDAIDQSMAQLEQEEDMAAPGDQDYIDCGDLHAAQPSPAHAQGEAAPHAGAEVAEGKGDARAQVRGGAPGAGAASGSKPGAAGRPALPENKQQNALQQDNNTSSLAQNALGQEDHVIFLEALQPTNIRPVECDDPNLPHVPSLAKTGDLSVHGWWQKQRLIDLPGAECLAHAAGENLTRASLASKIRYYSDRLLGHLFTANCNLRDALDPS